MDDAANGPEVLQGARDGHPMGADMDHVSPLRQIKDEGAPEKTYTEHSEDGCSIHYHMANSLRSLFARWAEFGQRSELAFTDWVLYRVASS